MNYRVWIELRTQNYSWLTLGKWYFDTIEDATKFMDTFKKGLHEHFEVSINLGKSETKFVQIDQQFIKGGIIIPQ